MFLSCTNPSSIASKYLQKVQLGTRMFVMWNEFVCSRVELTNVLLAALFTIVCDESLSRPSNISLINSIGFPQTMMRFPALLPPWCYGPTHRNYDFNLTPFSISSPFWMFDVPTYKLFPSLWLRIRILDPFSTLIHMLAHMWLVGTIVYRNNSSN